MVTSDAVLPAQLGQDVQAAHAGQLEVQEQQVVLGPAGQALEELLPGGEVGGGVGDIHVHGVDVPLVLGQDALDGRAERAPRRPPWRLGGSVAGPVI